MKNKVLPITIIMLLLAAGTAFADKTKSDKIQKIEYGYAVSAAYYPAQDWYIISNIGISDYPAPFGMLPGEEPTIYDGFVAYTKFRMDTIFNYNVLPNLAVGAPAGMEVIGDSLFVIDTKTNELIGYNLATQQVFSVTVIDTGKPRLRDICYANDGNLYISGSSSNTIYKYNIAADSVEKLQPGGDNIINPIGLLYEEEFNRIVIVTYETPGRILSLDLDSNYVRTIRELQYEKLIGIARDGSGRYHISSYSRNTQWEANYFTFDNGLEGEFKHWDNWNCHEVYYDKYNDIFVRVYQTGVLIEPLLYDDPVNIVYPQQNAQNVETDLKFEWNRQPLTRTYIFRLADNPNFTKPLIDKYIHYPDSTFSIDNLQLNKTYYWTVTGYENDMNFSPNSATFTFTTSATEKPAPQLVYPPNDTTNIKTFLTFQWQPLQNVDYYIVQFSSKEDMSKTFKILMITDSSYFYDLFGFGMDYFWRIKSTKGINGSPWSNTWHFKTAEPYLSYPELISPQKYQFVADTNLLFEWDSVLNAESYQFRLRNAHSNEEYVFYKNIDSLSFYLTDFKQGNSYDWGVRACNFNGYSEWETSQNHISDSIVPPPIIKPIPGGNPETLKPTLTWTDIGAEKYTLQIAEEPVIKGIKGIIQQQSDRDFRVTAYEKYGITDTTFTLDKALNKDKNYIWRVRGVFSDTVVSKWSEVAKFNTSGKISVEESIYNENNIQAYPNPAYDFLNLIVTQGMDENTMLELYDSFGKRVKAVYRINVGVDTSELSVNTSNLSSGIYQAVIKAGEKVYTTKFSVVR